MPRTRNISACFVSIETINVTIRHPLLVDTSLCSYRSLLNLVVRSPAEHRSWCPGSRVHHPQPRTTAACPHYPAALMAGVNHNKENISILAGYWNVGVSLRLRVAPSSWLRLFLSRISSRIYSRYLHYQHFYSKYESTSVTHPKQSQSLQPVT